MKKNIIFLLATLAISSIPYALKAQNLVIGNECVEDSNCVTDECEESDKINENTKQPRKYCVCDDDEDCTIYGGVTDDWSCSNGASATFDLNYCIRDEHKSTTLSENIKAPAGFTDPSVIDLLLDPTAAVAGLTKVDEVQMILNKPRLSIKIPGLDFTDPAKLKTVEEDGSTFISIPYIGEYIAAVYKYAIAVIGILAVVMIIIAGVQWMAPGNIVTSWNKGEKESANQAKKRIAGAITGLIIAVSSYGILYTINPELVNFRNLKVLLVQKKEIIFEDEDSYGELTDLNNENYVGTGTSGGGIFANLIGSYDEEKYGKCTKAGAQWAANAVHNLGVCVAPCHCAWTATRFLRYIGCGNPITESTFKIARMLEAKGWIVQKVTPSNYENLPVGILIMKGHTGVSIGDGYDFESAEHALKIASQKSGANCADKTLPEVFSNPSLCVACAKVPGHEPYSGKGLNNATVVQILKSSLSIAEKTTQIYETSSVGKIIGKKKSHCSGIQGWTKSKLNFGNIPDKGWMLVYSPPGSVTKTNIMGCCQTSNKNYYLSKELCEMYILKQPTFAKKFTANVSKESCEAGK